MRAYPAARILERHYEIELIGPAFGGRIYEPYRDEFTYKSEMFDEGWWQTRWKRRFCSLYKSMAKPYRMITGDVVYAFKPRPSSFGTGLLRKCLGKRPLVLDIDDWDAQEYFAASWPRKCRKLLQLGDPWNIWYARGLEPLVRLADERTVNSSFLQARYGGVKVWSAVDCVSFDPDRYDRRALRQGRGVDQKTILLFAGKPTPHKGLREVCQALQRIGSPQLQLMIVGPKNDHLAELLAAYPEQIIYAGSQPHRLMPEFLSLADIVILAQQKTPYAEAQVPGKLFEAMAMAKPIVATAVSDLPEILAGCGWVIPPADAGSLADSIRKILDDPDKAASTGRKARQKCLENYSLEAIEKTLLGIFQRYE